MERLKAEKRAEAIKRGELMEHQLCGE